MRFRRVVLCVLDSVGIGQMPDAADYDVDAGADTLGNIALARPLSLPNLTRLGLANIRPFAGLEAAATPDGCYGRCTLASPGKDTTTGHWEIAGIVLDQPFPLFPHGFPPEVLEPFQVATGRGTLGNKAASGTEIIAELGAEHIRTGKLIVYTSADSVFQIAAHEGVVPVPELYAACEKAREILRGRFEVGRVIARPFVGEPGAFVRTANRHDYAVPPPQGMLLDVLAERGVRVTGVGKIADVYLNRGVARSLKTKDNAEGMAKTLEALASEPDGLIFINLVDFDQLFGHRNNVEGYARALEQADAWIPELESSLRADDLVIFTADHGNDPTTPSTDHNREYVPLLATGPRVTRGGNLGTRASLADIGQTIAENFGGEIGNGASFLADLVR